MSSARIGKIKDGRKVSMQSNIDLVNLINNDNSRGRDIRKCKIELTKRGVKY